MAATVLVPPRSDHGTCRQRSTRPRKAHPLGAPHAADKKGRWLAIIWRIIHARMTSPRSKRTSSQSPSLRRTGLAQTAWRILAPRPGGGMATQGTVQGPLSWLHPLCRSIEAWLKSRFGGPCRPYAATRRARTAKSKLCWSQARRSLCSGVSTIRSTTPRAKFYKAAPRALLRV